MGRKGRKINRTPTPPTKWFLEQNLDEFECPVCGRDKTATVLMARTFAVISCSLCLASFRTRRYNSTTTKDIWCAWLDDIQKENVGRRNESLTVSSRRCTRRLSDSARSSIGSTSELTNENVKERSQSASITPTNAQPPKKRRRAQSILAEIVSHVNDALNSVGTPEELDKLDDTSKDDMSKNVHNRRRFSTPFAAAAATEENDPLNDSVFVDPPPPHDHLDVSISCHHSYNLRTRHWCSTPRHVPSIPTPSLDLSVISEKNQE